MMLKKWEQLPPEMQTEEVRKYYDILKKKQVSLFFKRVFDIVASSIMLIILSPVFLILAIAIKIDSKGPVFYRQVRVTQYNKKFRIFKFRTMCQGADKTVFLKLLIHPSSRIFTGTRYLNVFITHIGNFLKSFLKISFCLHILSYRI